MKYNISSILYIFWYCYITTSNSYSYEQVLQGSHKQAICLLQCFPNPRRCHCHCYGYHDNINCDDINISTKQQNIPNPTLVGTEVTATPTYLNC